MERGKSNAGEYRRPARLSRAPLERWREATEAGEPGDTMSRCIIAMLIRRNGIDQQNRGWFNPDRRHLACACYGPKGCGADLVPLWQQKQ